jgi:hypothetical protein
MDHLLIGIDTHVGATGQNGPRLPAVSNAFLVFTGMDCIDRNSIPPGECYLVAMLAKLVSRSM